MRRHHRIVTGVAVLLGTGVVTWWMARDGSRGSAPFPASATAAVAQETAADGGPEAGAGQRAGGETAAGVTGQTAEQAIAAHRTAARGPEQPIPFSHAFHASELAIDCTYCHAGTERSSTGVVPALEVCMGCHRVAGTGLEPIEELRGYWSRNEPVPWEWVNKLPDFVQFSHRAHLRNDLACETCHGPVSEMDRVYQWAPFTMGWCLECHRSQPEPTDLATDYHLAQEDPPPEPPSRRQPGSLYPTTIDQRYGAFRAPIDCLACHY